MFGHTQTETEAQAVPQWTSHIFSKLTFNIFEKKLLFMLLLSSNKDEKCIIQMQQIGIRSWIYELLLFDLYEVLFI